MTAVARRKLVDGLYTLLTYGRPPLTTQYPWLLYCELKSLAARSLDMSVLFSVGDSTPVGLIPYADRDQYTPMESRLETIYRLRSPAEVAEDVIVTLLQERRFEGFEQLEGLQKEDVRRFILRNVTLMDLPAKDLDLSLDATIVFLVSHSSPELHGSLEERSLLEHELFQRLLTQALKSVSLTTRPKNRRKKKRSVTSQASLVTTGVTIKGKFKVIFGGARSTGRVATSLTIKKLQILVRAEGETGEGLSKKELCSTLERILGQKGRLKVL